MPYEEIVLQIFESINTAFLRAGIIFKMDSDTDCHDIFLTQNVFTNSGFHAEESVLDAADDRTDNTLSDEELSQFVDVLEKSDGPLLKTNPLSVCQYENISSASEDELPVSSPPARDSRFRAPKTESEMEVYGNRSLAKSTKSKCKWAYDLFRNWQAERNKIAELDASISAIRPVLIEITKDEICYSMARFICEIRKQNGEEYPPNTLYELVISLQLFLDMHGVQYKLLQDDCFIQVRNTLDHVMIERAESGIVNAKRKALVITFIEEDLLWSSGVLGCSTPRKLVDTMLYLLGLHFALRAGQEHRNLRWLNSQLCLMCDSRGVNCLRYTEDVSKTNQGGLKHRRVNRKVVYAYEDSTEKDRCIVSVFRLYDQHCPPQRKAFYLRPLEKPNEEIWFSTQAIGLHSLTGTVARLCQQAGVPGFRTNHSLRATAATRLYEQDVDEQLISEITGHRSSAVRDYKRTNDSQRYLGNQIVSGRKFRAEGESDAKMMRSDPAITVNVQIYK